MVFCVDGAPDFLQGLVTTMISYKSDEQLQNNLICHTVDIVAPNSEVTIPLMEKLSELKTHDEKIKCAIEMCPVQKTIYSHKFIAQVAGVTYDRVKVVQNYNSKDIKKIDAPIVLLRPKDNIPNLVCDENYGLDKFTNSTVTVHYLEGTHVTIIENKDCANIINKVLLEKDANLGKQMQSVTSMVQSHRQFICS